MSVNILSSDLKSCSRRLSSLNFLLDQLLANKSASSCVILLLRSAVPRLLLLLLMMMMMMMRTRIGGVKTPVAVDNVDDGGILQFTVVDE